MYAPQPANEQPPFWKRIHWLVWCLFAAAMVLLIVDHWAHMLGVLPYLLLLACPLMHLFMHGKHGHGDHHDPGGKKP